ncbi:hypothetical protein JW879_00810 [candidate division WOR-3 bacterium]|nr:hypothetical protein [candidate division WOR-3 bacterium]
MNKLTFVYILGIALFTGFFVFGISSEQRLETEFTGSLICLSCIGIE